MKPPITGQTRVAGVVGSPVTHSLSPLIHNAWLEASGVDGVYIALSPAPDRFPRLLDGLRGGAVAGVNVTVPFKLDALVAADRPTARAVAAGAANLLLFERDGAILADNTDGEGMLAAFAEQAPGFDPARGPVVIFGAGGAARGGAAAFLKAGAPEVRIANRSRDKALTLASSLGARVVVLEPDARGLFNEVNAIINATTQGLGGGPGPSSSVPIPRAAVVMDMVYHPLETEFLRAARAEGCQVVDGLAMLIGQARPSFRAFFGEEPPAALDVRGLALRAMEGHP